jgi:CheY-like chemotaxis protein
VEVPGRSAKVLIVDDKPEGRYLLENLLSGHGYATVAVENGLAGLERLREEHFDLVISDILMPGMDGYQFCKHVRGDEDLLHLPFVFYTATYQDVRDEDLALKIGASAFLRKPAAPDTVLATVAAALEKQGAETAGLDTEDREVLKLYNERLVKKLESKMLQLEVEVSERRKAEEERRLIEQRMLQAQKLETLGMLANMVAHDFNNLLLGIMMNADLIQQDLPVTSPAHRQAEDIISISRQAADLCRQLLAYNGKRPLMLETMDLSRSIKEFTRLIGMSLPPSISVHYKLEEELPLVHADEKQIRQIILNLVQNSAEALGERTGSVTIATGSRSLSEVDIEQCLLRDQGEPGDYVFVEVEDTGCGMSHDVLQRICDPFFTTKDTGHGLGMAAVLGIAQGHSALLRIRTEPGRGTNIALFLPRAKRRVGQDGTVVSTTSEWQGSGQILVTDDESTVRQLAAKVLSRYGFEAIQAENGEEALTLLAKLDDCRGVIMDVRMPGMGGVSAFQEIRRQGYTMPVLFISGLMRSEDLQDMLLDFRVAFLQKPFVLEDLVNWLRQVVENSADIYR